MQKFSSSQVHNIKILNCKFVFLIKASHTNFLFFRPSYELFDDDNFLAESMYDKALSDSKNLVWK